MSGFIQGEARHQTILFPEALDDYITKENPIRVIDDAQNDHPEKQVSITDSGARLMKTKGMSRLVCYNIQSAVDSKHHLLVAHEVTNKTDRG